MNIFKRQLTTGSHDQIDSEALGKVDGPINQGDLGKLVKLGAASFDVCAAGDLIDGQVYAIDAGLVNDGFRFGSVKKGPRLAVAVKTASTAEVGKIVVAAEQEAFGAGSAKADPYINGLVDLAADQDTTKSRWRIYEVLGDSTSANCKVIIERF